MMIIDRVAAVTGANKGIGFFIAFQLASSGLFSHVILGCRDAARGQRAVSDIERQLSQTKSSSSPCNVLSMSLTLGDNESHETFTREIEGMYGKLDVLVNNAATAFKGSDPTPFREQTKPTLDINYRGTVHLTQTLLPLLRKGTDARIVNVASMAGYLDQLTSDQLKQKFTSSTLTLVQLDQLVNQFESSVQTNSYKNDGWGNSNYGMSKLAVIAATRVIAREENDIKVNCCCPGYCDTDMTSHKGPRPPSDGARNAVIPATMPQQECPSGAFFKNYEIARW